MSQKLFSNLWAALVAQLKARFTKDRIVKFFKQKFVEKAIISIFKMAPKGFYGWVVNMALNKFYDEVGEPLIELGIRRVGYVYHKVEGKVLIKKLKKAQGEGDEDSYDDIVDDILS
jgi:hypothetical protein